MIDSVVSTWRAGLAPSFAASMSSAPSLSWMATYRRWLRRARVPSLRAGSEQGAKSSSKADELLGQLPSAMLVSSTRS